MEYTFVMIKPEGVKRRLVGEIIKRFERKGLTLCAMKMVIPDEKILDLHYDEHKEKVWWPNYKKHLLSGCVIPMVWSGMNAVKVARDLIGSTDPLEALRGTIRGDFGLDKGRNLIHGAADPDVAKKETEIWFGKDFITDASFDHLLIYE